MSSFLKVYWPLLLIGLIGLWVAFSYVEPPPPNKITLATGTPDGAYNAYGEKYRDALSAFDVEVELVASAGSVENLELLRDGTVDAAIMQGGIAHLDEDAETIGSLGGIFHEGMWVFVRADYAATSFHELKQARMAIGPVGSGTRSLALHVQEEFGNEWSPMAQLELGGSAARAALIRGDIDAAIFVTSPKSTYLRPLLENSDVRLLPFSQSQGLARRTLYLAPVTLLKGVINPARSIPATDIPLIAPVAQMQVSKDLHPAIQALLLEAAQSIHAEGNLFAELGHFPDAFSTDLPLTPQAHRYYRSGPSFLRRILPFGVANFFERAWVLLIPILTLLIPLFRVAPPLYRWRIRRKIYVWYEDLRLLEARGRLAKDDTERKEIREHLTQLQHELSEVAVPLSYTDDLYRLRSHVVLVNQILA